MTTSSSSSPSVIAAVLHDDMSLRDDEPDSSIGEILDEIEALRSIYPDLDITDLSDNQCKEIRYVPRLRSCYNKGI